MMHERLLSLGRDASPDRPDLAGWTALYRAALGHGAVELAPEHAPLDRPWWAARPDGCAARGACGLDVLVALVHRAEQAQLLREAAALRLAVELDLPPGAPGAFSLVLGRRDHRSWRRALADAVALAAADGVEVPAELAACALAPPQSWGPESVEALLRAADLLDPDVEGELLRAVSALVQGRPEAAEGRVARALRGGLVAFSARPRRVRARLELTRALARGERGRITALLAPLERARGGLTARERAQTDALALAAAVVAGEAPAARRAARRLGPVPRGRAAEVAEGVARCAARWDIDGPVAPGCAAEVFAWIVRADESVARTLLVLFSAAGPAAVGGCRR